MTVSVFFNLRTDCCLVCLRRFSGKQK